MMLLQHHFHHHHLMVATRMIATTMPLAVCCELRFVLLVLSAIRVVELCGFGTSSL